MQPNKLLTTQPAKNQILMQPRVTVQSYLSSMIKQINVKQAQKWLQKLKSQNQQSYKQITKFLRKYDKAEDQHECYLKISHILLSHSELTKDINNYLEEGNKFVVNKLEDEKIKDLMAYVKKYRTETFNKILTMINTMNQAKADLTGAEINSYLKQCLREIVKGDEELEKITQKALDLTGEELINRQDLEHLKTKKNLNPIEDDDDEDVSNNHSKKRPKKQPTKPVREENDKVKQPVKQKVFTFNSLTSVSEERAVFKQLEKETDPTIYNFIVKVVKLFFLNIITKAEAFELLNQLPFEEELEYLKDIIDARQLQRRKISDFRPLNDLNFNNFQRASPSYVTIPFSYPIKCSGRSDNLRKILNEKWVSVPHGSEENQNFSVRNKNTNQNSLLSAEDERYEFDIYMRRLRKTSDFLSMLLDGKTIENNRQRAALIKKIIDLGVLQIIYKNGHKDQKDEIEWHMKANELEACRIFKARVQLQINELKSIKEVYANKSWSEVATKNYSKALDLKGFEFKKNEKEKMKGASFIQELNERAKLLENGGGFKLTLIPFQDKREFFSVLNSFESSSRSERCTNRAIPAVEQFDMKDQYKRHFYPVLIMSFEDLPICQKVFSLIIFYIDASPMSEQEKTRCKLFLDQLLISYIGWQVPCKKSSSEHFDEDKLYQKINKSDPDIDVSDWLIESREDHGTLANQGEQSTVQKLRYFQDEPSRYSYYPIKSEDKKVLYGSEHLYTVIRFIYALYERLIKMREVAENQEKIQLFQLLFFACIKSKQGIKFQENLNFLFGKHAYLFSTLYKLFDNLIKSISSASICLLTNQSLKLMDQLSEDIYFVKLNTFALLNNLASMKILRLTFQRQTKVLYINNLQSYYKSDDLNKDCLKKRLEINRSIEYYTMDSHVAVVEKKRRKNEVLQRNQMEYIFQGNTIKMLNHQQTEDVLLYVGKKQPISKMLKRELKRAHRIIAEAVNH